MPEEYQVLRNYLHQIWSQGIDVASSEIRFLSDFRIDLNEHPIPEQMAERLRDMDKSWHLKEYGNTSGDPFVREALVRLENARLQTDLYSISNVMITLGATGAGSMIYKGFLRPGARILMIPPIYYVFAGAAEQLGMTVDMMDVRREDDFLPTIDGFEAALNAHDYDLVLITNPTYPIGRIYPAELLYGVLDCIAAFNKKRPCLAILDEVYAQMAFDLERVRYGPRLANYEFLLRTNSMSKSFGTAGLRIGYFCAHPELCRRTHQCTGWPVMDFLNDLGDLEYGTPPPVFGPYIEAACDFFRQVQVNGGSDEAAFWRRNLARHWEKYLIAKSMIDDAGLDYVAPECAFSVMVELRGARTPQDQFALFRALLAAKKVYALPGALYRMPDEVRPAMVRVSFGQPEALLRDGLARALDFWLTL
ncbi:MAG: pyridoxal phosphate-dependent aminotransferase [Candidatus Coatesbacteria bacterium]|nr:pyridoxal phosphate-dependent aminotransferase [Candidatus Coatesbacteria bacterium]